MAIQLVNKDRPPFFHPNHSFPGKSRNKSFNICDYFTFTMKNAIQQYLNFIPLGSQHLYNKIHEYRMSYEEMQTHGYPLPDREDRSKITIMFDNMFDIRDDPSMQKCRCGKIMSILEENWYLDEAGCTYHPGKRVFPDGTNNASFSCCRKPKDSPGCSFSRHHVSFHRPYVNVSFLQTVKKNGGNRKRTSNIFALDCEMVFTTSGLEVAKVTLIDIAGNIAYDSYVLPQHEILDYNFEFSGIDESKLKDVTTTLSDVQNRLSELLNKDTILIGHCLANDFLSLNMVHENVVDTACLFPHELGHPYRHSLKHLTLAFLKKTIQVGNNGHNSIEDARSCMELVLWKVHKDTGASQIIVPCSTDPRNSNQMIRFPPPNNPNQSLLVRLPPNILYLPFRPPVPVFNLFSPPCFVSGPLHWWPFWRRDA